jgi:rhomboid protease GluP
VAEARKSAPKVKSTMQGNSPAVLAIIGINVAMYLLETFFPVILDKFSEQPAAIANGEYWRLFTAMFLHAPLGARFGIFHILFNMYILRIYGPNVEEAFGKVRFVVMYLIAGLAGGTLSYLLSDCRVSGVGASGAIFGVVGILLVYLYRRRSSTFVRAYQRSLMTFVGINLVFGFVVPGIDNWAHIGGLAGGLLLGAGLDAGPAGNVARGREVATILGVLWIIAAVIVFRTATMPAGCLAFFQ